MTHTEQVYRRIKGSINTDDQDYFKRKRKEEQQLKTDVCKIYQKSKLIDSSDEYKEEEEEEEEENDADDSYDNNQKSVIIPSVKKLPLLENRNKKASSTDSEEENYLLICKLPKVCQLLNEEKDGQKKKMNYYLMMNYWCRKALKYPREEDRRERERHSKSCLWQCAGLMCQIAWVP
jgi:hypothetical protein